VVKLTQKQNQCKVYEFTPRKGPKLKTVKYISPEKKELTKQRVQAKRDKMHFLAGVGVLLIIATALTFLSLR